MTRAFIGLAGILVGSILLVPPLLFEKTLSEGGVGGSPIFWVLRLAGLIVLIGVPLLFWVILPLLERRQRERNEP